MNTEQAEGACSNLSYLQLNTIRSKVLNYKELPENYTIGEALIFWVADMLAGTKLLQHDQLRLLIDELHPDIRTFGDKLEASWNEQEHSLKTFKKLPMCKIGFLDRKLVCMDGRSTFIDLTSGSTVEATDNMPLETIVYNLTTLFLRYKQLIKANKNVKQSRA